LAAQINALLVVLRNKKCHQRHAKRISRGIIEEIKEQEPVRSSWSLAVGPT
jgi:hypothetical protein